MTALLILCYEVHCWSGFVLANVVIIFLDQTCIGVKVQ